MNVGLPFTNTRREFPKNLALQASNQPKNQISNLQQSRPIKNH